jgi:3-oxocholest-4-en-26-oate---CoA ligase
VRDGAALTGPDIREYATEHVARFKAPRAVRLCDRIARHPSGKADYAWAGEAAIDAVSVTG